MRDWIDMLDGVYPRACGGADIPGDLNIVSAGLSPRVRGSPPGRKGKTPRPGSIPARAGEPTAAG